MAVLLEPAGKWNSIPGLCYMNPQKQYIDNGIARVLNFSRLVPPENSCFSTGANHSYNWRLPEAVSTHAHSASAVKKTGAHTVHWKYPWTPSNYPQSWNKNVRVLDRTFNYNPRRAKELLQLFLEFNPDICFHLEIHPALLSEELKMNWKAT